MDREQLERKRKRQREWKLNRRRAYFANKQCTRCGSRENLELDHIDASQKRDHRIWSWSAERREEELKKCQVLCRPCHKQKSIENGDYFHESAEEKAIEKWKASEEA